MTNISTRGAVAAGEGQLIAGFVVEGTKPQRVMIRGIGPTLEEYGIEDALVRPILKVDADPTAPPLAQGGFWWEGDRYGFTPSPRILDMFQRFGAFDLTGGTPPSGLGGPAANLDAVMILDLEPGAYTAIVSGVGSTTGVALVEVYELP